MKLKLILVCLLLLSSFSSYNENNNENAKNKVLESGDSSNVDNSDEFNEVYEECITKLRALKNSKRGNSSEYKKQQKSVDDKNSNNTNTNDNNSEKSQDKNSSEFAHDKIESEDKVIEEQSHSQGTEKNGKPENENEVEITIKADEEKGKIKIKEQEEELFQITKKDIILGDPTSKVKVIEYSSFTCPSCSYYNKKYFPNIYAKYIKTGKISYVIREIVNNKQDLYATLLVRCMLKHNGMEQYEKIRNVLFDKQNSWAFTKNFIDILTNIAQLSGLSDDLYLKCVNDKEMNDEIVAELEKIGEYKNDSFGTPFFVINKTPAANRFDLLETEIEKNILNSNKK